MVHAARRRSLQCRRGRSRPAQPRPLHAHRTVVTATTALHASPHAAPSRAQSPTHIPSTRPESDVTPGSAASQAARPPVPEPPHQLSLAPAPTLACIAKPRLSPHTHRRPALAARAPPLPQASSGVCSHHCRQGLPARACTPLIRSQDGRRRVAGRLGAARARAAAAAAEIQPQQRVRIALAADGAYGDEEGQGQALHTARGEAQATVQRAAWRLAPWQARRRTLALPPYAASIVPAQRSPPSLRQASHQAPSQTGAGGPHRPWACPHCPG
jgi:hypothetical protein